eukprot:2870971-Rhodomonas_salina.1
MCSDQEQEQHKRCFSQVWDFTSAKPIRLGHTDRQFTANRLIALVCHKACPAQANLRQCVETKYTAPVVQ